MTFESLGEFLSTLETRGDLVRVRRPVSRDLEITEVTQRVLRADGPALLFENVPGATMPVVTNLLGSPRRIALALGADSVDQVAERVGRLVKLRPPAGILGAVRDLAGTIDTLSTLRTPAPKRVRSGPCQEVEEATVDLDRLPNLK